MSYRLKRKALSLLPRGIRHSIIRRIVHYPMHRLNGLQIEIAHDERAYEAVFRLVHDAYVERGWIRPQRSGMWRTAHHALPEATVLALREGDDYLGTVTLLADSELGLPIDCTYPVEMTQRRGPGKKLVEVASLAVRPSVRRSGAWMCMAVAMWRHAVHCMHATDVVVALDPPVADYYEALFGFRRFTGVKHYRGFGDTATALANDPVVGLCQDVRAAEIFSTAAHVLAPVGEYNAFSLYDMAYPAHFEPSAISASGVDMTRYKLPRPVFQRFFGTQDTPISAKEQAYLARSRSRDTLQFSEDTREYVAAMAGIR